MLKKISSRITNEVAGINRVTYDISSKPPAVGFKIIFRRICLIFQPLRRSNGYKINNGVCCTMISSASYRIYLYHRDTRVILLA